MIVNKIDDLVVVERVQPVCVICRSIKAEIVFIDMEKAYDRGPRVVLRWTFSWKGELT